MIPEDNKYTWGESVIVSKQAPKNFRPGQVASVCGMMKVETSKLASIYKTNLGDWVYTIEFIGGDSIEIPEKYLEKDKE